MATEESNANSSEPKVSRLERKIGELVDTQGFSKLFNDVRREEVSHDFSTGAATRLLNRGLNRYRDVLPYDHSRVVLQPRVNVDVHDFHNHVSVDPLGLLASNDDDIDDEEDNNDNNHEAEEDNPLLTDYINASLVKAPLANRSYILTQGPLVNTAGHFWSMVWQRRSKAVLMLNRVMEKGVAKCHQYWPTEVDSQMSFPEVKLTVKNVSVAPGQHYTVTKLLVTKNDDDDYRELLHFHCTTWPDFGVPECPDSFLEFLKAVVDSGSLESDVGPPVVHCSAGIGRSGTLCLVDTCLVLLEKEGPDSVCVKQVLLELRKYRMGLIQTPDQLKFSYLAIAEGARQKGIIHNHILTATGSKVDVEVPPPPPPRSDSLGHAVNGNAVIIADKDTNLDPNHSHSDDGVSSESASEEPPTTTNSSSSSPSEEAPTTSTRATTRESANKKCILNNRKMEERKKEMELRRRERREALSNRIREMREKGLASEESKVRRRSNNTRMVGIVVMCCAAAAATAVVFYAAKSTLN